MTNAEGPHILEPVQAADGEAAGKPWPYRLMLFLRVMAGVSLCKGLYHWAVICGIGAPLPSGFDSYSTPYQVATVFFAVIDLVAGVGLWVTRAPGPGGGVPSPRPPAQPAGAFPSDHHGARKGAVLCGGRCVGVRWVAAR